MAENQLEPSRILHIKNPPEEGLASDSRLYGC